MLKVIANVFLENNMYFRSFLAQWQSSDAFVGCIINQITSICFAL